MVIVGGDLSPRGLEFGDEGLGVLSDVPPCIRCSLFIPATLLVGIPLIPHRRAPITGCPHHMAWLRVDVTGSCPHPLPCPGQCKGSAGDQYWSQGSSASLSSSPLWARWGSGSWHQTGQPSLVVFIRGQCLVCMPTTGLSDASSGIDDDIYKVAGVAWLADFLN